MRALPLLLLLALALACRVEESERTGRDSSLSPTAAPSAAAPEPDPMGANAPPARATREPPAASLEDLLRLPDSAGAVDPLAERLKPGAIDRDDERRRARVGIVLESHTDRSGVVPGRERSRSEAAVSADVDDSTRVRAGVRVEQETGQEREPPVPTVGIQKRF